MLVVTANWAWTDGSLVPPRPGRGVAWLREVHRAVLRTGFGPDGRYRPIEAFDIVFAGDTFDALFSRVWTDRLRPWHGGPEPASLRDQVLVAAARRARRLLAGLARWARTGMALPSTDRRGRPLPRAMTRAHVGVAFLAGARDRWLEAAAGVAARHHCRVGRIWADQTSVIRHGAEFDPCWCAGDPPPSAGIGRPPDPGLAVHPRPPFLGESIIVDLVARFAVAILDRRPASPAVSRLVGRLAAAAPLALPAILDDWRTTASEAAGLAADRRQRIEIETEWRRAVAAWHREARRLPPVCGIEACPIDWLAGWLERPASAPVPADVAARFATRPPSFPVTSRPRLLPPNCRPESLVLGHVADAEEAPDVDPARGGVVCLGDWRCGAHDPPTAVRTGRRWARLPAVAGAASPGRTTRAGDATMMSGGIVRLPPAA